MLIENYAPNDITQFIPDYLLDDTINPTIITGLSQERLGLHTRDYVGFLTGLYNYLSTPKKGEEDSDDSATCSFFKTDEILDIRIIFRPSKMDDNQIFASKMRLYFTGKAYRRDTVETQTLDSGLLTMFSAHQPPDAVFQTALARTMLYKAAYSIGGPALIKKMNVPAPEDSVAPSFRMLANLRPMYDETIPRDEYTHILDAACRKAGMDSVSDIGVKAADDILHLFLHAKDPNKCIKMLRHVSDDSGEKLLYPEEAEEIVELNQSDEANIAGESPAEFQRTSGMSLVYTLKLINEILNED